MWQMNGGPVTVPYKYKQNIILIGLLVHLPILNFLNTDTKTELI